MGRITVVGHGYEKEHLTLGAAEALKSGAKVILHTGRCGCAEWLDENEIPYETLDALYEECEDFDEHAEAAADAVRCTAEDSDVVYGVFDVRDRSVAVLNSENIRVIAGPPVEGALFAQIDGPVQLLEASDWENYALSSARSAIVRELDSRELAGEVKLKLMEIYPEESRVRVAFADGRQACTELYNLDRLSGYDHRTCVFVPAEKDLTKLERYDFDRFVEIIARLCGPDGCPWDREQTHESLRSYIVEEAYEVVGAIDEDDPWHLYDELGDMLLQVVLHADVGRRYGEFDISDVITAISEKMIHRHTHVFGQDRAENAGEVTDLWTRNKMAERGEMTRTESMRGVSRSLPAMMRAVKVLKRLDGALKQKESAERARKALLCALQNADGTEEAAGEVLLCTAALVRALDVDPELALNGAVDRLIGRFEKVENGILKDGGALDALDGETLKKYWDLVKLSDAGK